MVIDFYGNGGGSGGGVTPQQVQAQIDSALTQYTETEDFATINGSGITSGGNLVIEGGPDLSDYWTSAQTQDAISAATSGKADAANVTPNNVRSFPRWNAQGIITGTTGDTVSQSVINWNGVELRGWFRDRNGGFGPFYAPTDAGTAGDILVSAGNGAPVWSAITIPDLSIYWTSAETQSAINTNVDSAYTILDGHITDVEALAEDAICVFGEHIYLQGDLEGILADANIAYYDEEGEIYVVNQMATEDYVQEAIPDMSEYTPTSGFSTINGSAITAGGNLVIQGGSADLSDYWTSAETQSAISTASGSLQTQLDTMDEVVADALNDINGELANKVSSSFVRNIWKGTQAQYDAISAKTATTLYIII